MKSSTNRHLSAAAPPFGSLCYAIPAFKHCNCQRDDLFLSRAAGFVQIPSLGKSGTPPCKSGQFEKDLGLEASSLRHAARLIIFEIMRSFFLGSKEQATKLAALHWGKRADRSARSPSVLEHYATLTCVALDFATGVVGRCTFSTPSRNSAVTFVLSASSGSVKLRRKVP